MRPSFFLLLPLLGVVACDGKNQGDDSDTGTSGGTDPVVYESGCITVDGEGGYKYIQDAITVASEGSIIALCDGTYEEAVVVDKGVEIVGASREGTIVSAPANSAAFTVTGSGANVHSLTVRTTKDGVVFSGASNSTVSDITLNEAPNYTVSFENSTDVSVEDCSIDLPGYTAVKANGGSATLARCSITRATSVAIDVLGGADLTLDSNTIEGVLATTDEDGNAITAVDSSLTMISNQILAADAFGLNADNTDVSMTGDSISNTLLGVRVVDGDFVGTGLTLSENALLGMILAAPGSVSLSDSTISVADNSLCGNTYDSFWNDGSIACGGIYGGALTMSLSNVSVSGYDTYGVFIVTYDGTSTETLDNVQVSNTGRSGIIITPGDGTATISNSSVTGLREIELPEPCGDSSTGQYSATNTPALYLLDGDITVTDSSFTDNAGWGIASAANLTMSGTTFGGNGCSSVINIYGTLTATNNTFNSGDTLGTIWDYYGVSTLIGNTFVGGHDISRYDYDTVIYEYTGGGVDLNAAYSTSVVVQGNTFSDGDSSLNLYSVGTASISDNTWDDYDGVPLSISDCADITVEDNTISNSYGYSLSAYGTNTHLNLNNLSIVDSRDTESTSRTYDNSTGTPVLIDEYSYTSSAYEMIYLGSATADITDLNANNVQTYYSLYTSDASVSVDGANLDAGDTFLYGYSYSAPPDILLQNVNVGNLTGSLVSLYNYTGATGNLYISDATVESAYSGINISGMMDVTLENMSLDGMSSYGLNVSVTSYDTNGDGTYETLTPGTLAITDSSFTTTGSYGILATATDIQLDNASVEGAMVTGINLNAPNIVVYNSNASSLFGDGLSVSTGTIDVEGNVFTNNGGYGMVCSGVTIGTCNNNDLSNNTAGMHNGCDDACGMP